MKITLKMTKMAIIAISCLSKPKAMKKFLYLKKFPRKLKPAKKRKSIQQYSSIRTLDV